MRVTATVNESFRMELSEHDALRIENYAKRAGVGTIVNVDYERPTYTRSIRQNRYYHGAVVEPLRKYLGIETSEAMHEVLKDLHLATSIRLPFDRRKKMKIPKSTKELKTGEFEEYLERIRKWARKFLKFEIPLPNNSPYPYDHQECKNS